MNGFTLSLRRIKVVFLILQINLVFSIYASAEILGCSALEYTDESNGNTYRYSVQDKTRNEKKTVQWVIDPTYGTGVVFKKVDDMIVLAYTDRFGATPVVSVAIYDVEEGEWKKQDYRADDDDAWDGWEFLPNVNFVVDNSKDNVLIWALERFDPQAGGTTQCDLTYKYKFNYAIYDPSRKMWVHEAQSTNGSDFSGVRPQLEVDEYATVKWNASCWRGSAGYDGSRWVLYERTSAAAYGYVSETEGLAPLSTWLVDMSIRQQDSNEFRWQSNFEEYFKNRCHNTVYTSEGQYYISLYAKDSAEKLVARIEVALPKPGDINVDGCVDLLDLRDLTSAIRRRSSNPKYDLNDDSRVNIADSRKLVKLFDNRGQSCN